MKPTPAPFTDRLSLRSLPDLVAAIPAMLGFHPADSLVLIGLAGSAGEDRIHFVVRADLPGADPPPPGPGELAGYLANQGCTSVVLVVVGGGPSKGGPPHRQLVRLVARACHDAGVVVRASLWAEALARGRPWRGYHDRDRAGTLPDPSASELAAGAVADGRVILPDRTALERLVAEGEPATLARRARLLNDRIDEIIGRGGAGAPAGASALSLVERWVARTARDILPTGDGEIVELCLALADPTVRDACLGFALDDRAAAAERLWMTLVSGAPDPESAEPAVLLACAALARRDGGLAGVALQRAHRAWPGHRLSTMLDQALRAGCGPEQVLRWCAEGAAQATELLCAEATGR